MQLSAMSIAIRPALEASMKTDELLARQEKTFRMDHEKMAKELEHFKAKMEQAIQDREEALKFRQIAEDQAASAEKRIAKVERELEKKNEAVVSLEAELAHHAEQRVAEMEAARKGIEREFLLREVQPKLTDYREKYHRKGFSEGFQSAKDKAIAMHPKLAQSLKKLKFIVLEAEETTAGGDRSTKAITGDTTVISDDSEGDSEEQVPEAEDEIAEDEGAKDVGEKVMAEATPDEPRVEEEEREEPKDQATENA